MKKKTANVIIGIVIIAFILVFAYIIAISNNYRFDITSPQIFTNEGCHIVNDCSTDTCANICKQYLSCTVIPFENTQIACINGDKIGISIPNSVNVQPSTGFTTGGHS